MLQLKMKIHQPVKRVLQIMIKKKRKKERLKDVVKKNTVKILNINMTKTLSMVETVKEKP